MNLLFAKDLVRELIASRGIAISDADKLERFLSIRPELTTEPYVAFSFGAFNSLPTMADNGYFYFDPTHLISTKAIKNLRISWTRRFLDDLLIGLGQTPSDTDALVREISDDSNMLDIMRRNSNPFALLGTLNTFLNIESLEGPLVSSRKPILVLPRLSQQALEYIKAWEESRTVYEKEKGFMYPASRISKDEFLALS